MFSNMLKNIKLLSVAGLFILPTVSQANVVIGGTRLVYMSSNKDISVQLQSDNPKPVLVQMWIDDGDMAASPKDMRTPFSIPTPVFRMDPQRKQIVRIIYSGGSKILPSDRESLFWLNALEVPSVTSADKNKNILQMAFRTRIKIFYRPDALRDGIAEAPKSLSVSLENNSLHITNPTPYHISFSGIEVTVGGKKYKHANGGMVEPKSQGSFALAGLSGGARSGTVALSLINDYGATEKYVGNIGGALSFVR